MVVGNSAFPRWSRRIVASAAVFLPSLVMFQRLSNLDVATFAFLVGGSMLGVCAVMSVDATSLPPRGLLASVAGFGGITIVSVLWPLFTGTPIGSIASAVRISTTATGQPSGPTSGRRNPMGCIVGHRARSTCCIGSIQPSRWEAMARVSDRVPGTLCWSARCLRNGNRFDSFRSIRSMAPCHSPSARSCCDRRRASPHPFGSPPYHPDCDSPGAPRLSRRWITKSLGDVSDVCSLCDRLVRRNEWTGVVARSCIHTSRIDARVALHCNITCGGPLAGVTVGQL